MVKPREGSPPQAAETLGIGYSTLKSKLKAYGIGSDEDD